MRKSIETLPELHGSIVTMEKRKDLFPQCIKCPATRRDCGHCKEPDTYFIKSNYKLFSLLLQANYMEYNITWLWGKGGNIWHTNIVHSAPKYKWHDPSQMKHLCFFINVCCTFFSPRSLGLGKYSLPSFRSISL